jgi:DNA helicase-2/ATP-dependent DNA helicase PcrA
MTDFLDELNDIQREAVLQSEGPVMIVAGPGSGKTRVLTYRIAHLLKQGASPFSILSLTFTNKAAESMRNRIESIQGTNARSLFMGTFHSIFARILRVDAQVIGYPSNFTIYDTEDSKSVIKSIIKELQLDDKIYKPSTIQWRISACKNALIFPEDYASMPELASEDKASRRPQTSEIYRLYCERCFKSGAMDFDDLLLKTYELIKHHPDILYKYQHKFKYVLIDEFQDTNQLQYAIIKKIADVYQNITVVGDDAQSIYAFRGATIDNILNFEKDYPDLKVFKLEQNYRSTQTIVKAANELIHKNKNQIKKEIWTSNNKGELIKVVKLASDNDEGRWVADSIMELKLREHYKNQDFAILYRTNAQSRAFEESLRKHNISYKIYGGMSFYQRKEIKDFLAYIKLTINPYDEEAFKRVINYPTRGIGQTTIDKIFIYAANQGKRVWDVVTTIHQYDFPTRAKQLIADFAMMIQSFSALSSQKNAFDLATHIGQTTKLIADLYHDKTLEGIARYENIQELLNGIKEFVEDDQIVDDDVLTDDRGLGTYLQNISLLTGEEKNDNPDAVKLMTTHAAKGLEFPVVYIVGMEEGLFPSSQSLYSLEDLEEERRLFYVAITRAESKLFITHATSRYKFGTINYADASRFIKELPDTILDTIGSSNQVKQSSTPNVNERESLASSFGKILTKTAQKAPVRSNSDPFVPDDVSELQNGAEVIHEKFGEGKVIFIEGSSFNRIATIFFPNFGEKKIMLKFAKLKIVKHPS